MGRNKRTASEVVQRARDNGFDDDMKGIDDSIIFKPIEDYTRLLYNQIWVLWIECVPLSLSYLSNILSLIYAYDCSL